MLSIVLGTALFITSGIMGGVAGIKLGNWLEGQLTPEERKDLEKILDYVINLLNLNAPEKIKQLPNQEQEKTAKIILYELQSKWGQKRFDEVENQVKEKLGQEIAMELEL